MFRLMLGVLMQLVVMQRLLLMAVTLQLERALLLHKEARHLKSMVVHLNALTIARSWGKVVPAMVMLTS